MNANSTHLDLDDLIAEVTGQAIGDQAREHLARCEQCQLCFCCGCIFLGLRKNIDGKGRAGNGLYWLDDVQQNDVAAELLGELQRILKRFC